ncbi:MAG: Ldh family oxidoreductase [Chloroflexi bacterium]|nr:Ldh family oxidoreductase [Chloroflexota bacterium]
MMGHKGYALMVMTEVFAGILSGAGASGEALDSKGNGLLFQAIDIEAFTPLDTFIARVRQFIAHVKSSRPQPGVTEILLPGEPEYRTAQQRSRDGLLVEDSIWEEIRAKARELHVPL